MAVHGREARVLVQQYDLSAYFRQASEAHQVDVHETTTFGKPAKSFLPGLAGGSLSLQGLFDGSPDAVDAVLGAALGAPSRLLTYAPNGLVVGRRVGLLEADETSYSVTSPVADVVGVEAAFQATGGIDGGVSLHALAAESASGTGTAVDHGAATASGGVAHLHVTAAAGTTPALAVKVQHSADNVTFADLVTFTAQSGVAAERVAVAGTVNRYVRAVWTITGTTPAFTFAVAFARR